MRWLVRGLIDVAGKVVMADCFSVRFFAAGFGAEIEVEGSDVVVISSSSYIASLQGALRLRCRWKNSSDDVEIRIWVELWGFLQMSID